MSNGMNGKNGKGSKILPLIIILLLLGGGGLAPVMIGLSVVLGFVAVAALVIALIVKALKGTDEVTVIKKDGTSVKTTTQPTKNPYSVNYDKVLVEQSDAEKQRLKEAEEAAKAAKAAKNIKAAPVVVETPKVEEPKHRKTGDADIDKMIVEKDEAIEKMKALDEAIEDEKLSEQIVHLESVTEKIVNYVADHPKKKKQLGKFFDYYLPTTLKLLEAYGRMDEAGISGTNIDGTKEKVEGMMDTALAAFDKQLDALYADEALDVSTDITVMQNMLKSEGLTEDDITLTL